MSRKQWIRPIAAGCILAVGLSAAGCSKTNHSTKTNGSQKAAELEEAKEMGRYIEEPVKLPELEKGEEYCNYPLVIKNQFQVMTYAEPANGKDGENLHPLYKVYTKEGKEWTIHELPDVEEKHKNANIIKVLEYEKGKWYLLCADYSSIEEQSDYGEPEYLLYRYDEERKDLEDVTPKQWFDASEKDEGEGPSGIDGLDVDASGNILYYTWRLNEIYRYNPETGERKSIPLKEECYGGVYIKGNQVYAYNGRDEITVMDLDTEEIVDTISREMSYSQGKIFVSDQEEIYYIGENGIECYQKGQSQWNKVIDGMGYSFGASDTSVQSAIITGEKQKEFYMYLNSRDSKIVHLYYDETIPTHKEQRLNICSLYSNEQIKDICNAYQQNHPEVEVSLNFMLGDEDTGLAGDTIKTINSELLAGEGADIYLMEGLSSQKMMDKGVFKDIAPMVKEQIDSGELLPNVMNAFQNESGKMYEIPLRVKVPFFVMKDDLGLDHPQFEGFYNKCKESDGYDYSTDLYVFSMAAALVDCYGDDWIDKDGKVNLDEWAECVEQMTEINKHSLYYNKVNLEEMGIDDVSKIGEYIYRKDSIGLFGGVPYQFISNKEVFGLGCADNLVDVFALSILKDQYHCQYSDINSCFLPSCIIGINANAAHTKEAESFLQYALSEEAQSREGYNGLPINTKSLEQLFFHNEDRKNGGASFSDGEGNSFDIDYQDVKDEDVQEFMTFMKSLQKRNMKDPKVEEILYVSALKVALEQSDVETERSKIENTLRLYLAE